MQQDLNRVIEQVSKEKGIDKSILINALENAMISAAKKTFGHQRKIEAQFNPEIGEVELFEAKTVVENVQDPAVEVTLQEAREALDPDAEIGDELRANWTLVPSAVSPHKQPNKILSNAFETRSGRLSTTSLRGGKDSWSMALCS